MTAEQPTKAPRPVCGAGLAHGGGTCRSTALYPNGRCKKHGGPTPSGIASPHFKTGEHMRHGRALDRVPGLKRHVEAIVNDESRLELNPEIAIMGGLISEAIERLATAENGELWTALVKARNEAAEAQRLPATTKKAEEKRKQAFAAAVDRMFSLIDRGGSAYAARQELVDLLDGYRKLTESERKRSIEMHDVVTSERIVLLLGALVGIVKDEIPDRTVVARIAGRIGGLVNGPALPAPGTGE